MKVLALALALAVGAAEPMAPARSTEEAGLLPGLPPGPPPPSAQVDALTVQIGLGLRCPVCQGLSVSDSTSEAAVSMQRRIRELVAAGYTQDQINDYFVDRYGEWILLDPPKDGSGLIFALLPALLAGGGLLWATFTVAQWRKEPDPVPLPSDLGQAPKDKYEERLLAELDE